MSKKWIVYILLLPICFGFYQGNRDNFEVYKQIRDNIIDHPENLPTSDTVNLSSVGFRNMVADIYWLQTVQYIGGNVISGEYKRFLYAMMDLITDIDPHFQDPYIIGQLLLPASDSRYEDFSSQEIQNNIHESIALGKKGVERFCDMQKVQKIIKEQDLEKIITQGEYANPCNGYKIPYYLAYIYYFHLHDSINSANYYKVVSAQQDAPSGARVLAAIMQGKGGEREKSIFMFLGLAKSVGQPGDVCTMITGELEKVYEYISIEELPIQTELVINIETLLSQAFPDLTEENELEVLDDTKCINYVAKAVREINLSYIEEGLQKFITENPGDTPPNSPEELLSQGYLSFIPTDYQQYKDKGYGIVYRYDSESGLFDYEMGSTKK